MSNFMKITLKLSIISAIFAVVSIVTVVITSLLTQRNIHPDYWILSTAEKVILFLLLAVYGLVIFKSFKRSQSTERHGIKPASPNQ